MTIHQTAIISAGAQIDPQVEIGPYTVIGNQVTIKAGTKIGAHVVIDGKTTIGEACSISAGAIIGLEPQDLRYKGEPTGVLIGNRVTIREFVTIHRATGEGFTIVDDDCFLMNYVHIAHNCKIGRGVIMANATMMAGHVVFGDHVVTSGQCVFHQFVRIGRGCMISGLSGTRKDLPPFTMGDGRPMVVRGINTLGLRRQKIGPSARQAVKQAYRLIYRSGLSTTHALSRVEEEIEPYPEILEIVQFFKQSKRGCVPAVVGELVEAEAEEDSDEAKAEVF